MNSRNTFAELVRRSCCALLIAGAWLGNRARAADIILDGTDRTYSTSTSQGKLVLTSGNNNLRFTNNATVTFAGLSARPAGTTIDFNAYSDITSLLGGTHKAFITGQAAGVIGPWALVNGGDLAVYDPAVGVRPMIIGETAADYATDLLADRHVKWTQSTLSIAADTTVASLNFGPSQSTVTIAPSATLTLSQGALLRSLSNDTVTINGGTITSGTNELIVGVSPAWGWMTINSTLKVPGGSVIKTGGGELQYGGTIDATTDLFVRDGIMTLTGDRTGQGVGRTLTAQSTGVIQATSAASLGSYTLKLEIGRLWLKNPMTIDNTILAGKGASISSDYGSSIIAGQIISTAATNCSLSVSGNITLGGGAADTRANVFNPFVLNSVGAGTILTLNKAPGVTAFGGDISLEGTIRLAADNQLDDNAQIAMMPGGILDLNGHHDTVTFAIASNAASSIKLSDGGSLTITGQAPVLLDNFGTIVGTGNLVSRATGIVYKGNDTFSGQLIVQGGSLTLANSRSTSGGIVLQGGTLMASSDGALGLAANTLFMEGGTFMAKSTFASNHPIVVRAAGGWLDVPTGTMTQAGAISGDAGLLRKKGSGTLEISGPVQFAGAISAEGGNVRIAPGASITAPSSLRTSPGGTLLFDTAPTGVRVAADVPIQLAGGTLLYSSASSETLGLLTPFMGHSTVSITGSGAALTFSALGTRSPGASVGFAHANGARTLVNGLASGSLGGWAVMGNNFAKYDPALGVVALDALDYSDQMIADAHVRLTATPPPTGSIAPRTLTLNASSGALDVTINSGELLTLNLGGLMTTGGAATTISGGSVTSGVADLVIHTNGSALDISSAIVGNIAVGKSGASTLRLVGAAANTYTGATVVNQGTLELGRTTNNAAVPGDLQVNGGTVTLLLDEQIADSATVTLNSGTFNLSGRTETIANFANNGGTFIAGGGRLIVTSPHTATLSAGSTTISSGQTLDATGLRITGGNNTVAAGGRINVYRTTESGEVSGGLSMEGSSPTITLASSAATPGILALGGQLTVNALGTALLASDTQNNTPGTIDLRGERTFQVDSALDISARLINGSITKRGTGVLRMMGASTFSGGILLKEGTLIGASASGLGTGTVTLDGGKFQLRNDASSVAYTAGLALAGNASVDINRQNISPMFDMKLLTGNFSMTTLDIGNHQLDILGTNGGSLAFTAVTTLSGSARINNLVTVNLAGAVNQSGGVFGLTKSGPGVLSLSGAAANTYGGPTVVNEGTLQLNKSAGVTAVPGDLTAGVAATLKWSASNQVADSATVTLSRASSADLATYSETVAALTVESGAALNSSGGILTVTAALNVQGMASLTPGTTLGNLNVAGNLKLGSGGRTTRVSSLAVSGTMDLTDNKLIVDYSTGSPLAGIRAAIQSAFDPAGSAHWVKPGLTSSLAAAKSATHGLGYAEASAVLSFVNDEATFGGQTVDPTTVLVRYTLLGDADLSGAVNFFDLTALAANYGANGHWSQGDFNLDGNVNFFDLTALAANYGSAMPTEPLPGAPADFGQDLALAFAQVPEPAGMILFGLALVGLWRPRRKA